MLSDPIVNSNIVPILGRDCIYVSQRSDQSSILSAGEGSIRHKQEEGGGETEDVRLSAKGRRPAGRGGKYFSF